MGYKLVTVGINEYPDAPLLGCVPDSHHMKEAWLANFGVGGPDCLQLLNGEATRDALVEAAKWLVKDATPYQDVLVFHMSSHGTQTRDANGDERYDHLDETLCPIDFEFNRPMTWFTDDMIWDAFGDVPVGVNLVVMIDACHSGSLLRTFPGQPASLGNRTAARAYPAREPFARSLLTTPQMGGWRGLLGITPPVTRLGTRADAHKAVLISATTSKQLAADAYIEGKSQGAHTYAFLKVLRARGASIPFAKLVALMRGWINQNGFGGIAGQTPQLQGRRDSRRLPAFLPFPRPA